MKVVFAGTPSFALTVLKKLYSCDNIEIVAVVTQTDKPKGRNHKIEFSPVKKFAIENNLKLLQPNKLKDEFFENELKNFNMDLFLVAEYGKIITEKILNMPKLYSINVHASLLPKYRGAAPIQHALINGETVTGVTIMQMDKGIDTGDIIIQKKCDISSDDTYGSLCDKLASLGADALLETIDKIINSDIELKKQDDSLATYAPMITKNFCRIDWHRTSLEILNLIRALKPDIGAYTFYDNKILKIWSAVNSSLYSNEECGKIIDAGKFVVKTFDGALMLTEVQEQGGKKMLALDYLRGHKLFQGAFLN
jgi:methionyl-tRNA formyltransferase